MYYRLKNVVGKENAKFDILKTNWILFLKYFNINKAKLKILHWNLAFFCGKVNNWDLFR